MKNKLGNRYPGKYEVSLIFLTWHVAILVYIYFIDHNTFTIYKQCVRILLNNTIKEQSGVKKSTILKLCFDVYIK